MLKPFRSAEKVADPCSNVTVKRTSLLIYQNVFALYVQ